MEASLKFDDLIEKPQGFVLGIVGKPGSGKTTLIKRLLTTTFAGKYSYIIIVSPSSDEYETLIPATQRNSVFSIQWLYKRINLINTTLQQKNGRVLLVIDDCIGEIKDQQKDHKVIGMFFNRRHLLWNSTFDYIITTQKYTMMPAKFRSCITDLAIFNLSPFDLDKIYEESIIRYTKVQWRQYITQLYSHPFEVLRFDLDKQIII